MNENVFVSIRLPLKFVPMGLIDYKSTFVQLMACCRTDDKPLSKLIHTKLPTGEEVLLGAV